MSHRTRDDEGRPLPERKPRRRKKRPNLIGSSTHRDAYHRLMQAGWSSTSLAFYAAQWFGETISASTFRSYRARKDWPARKTAANVRDGENETLPAGWDPRADHDELIDVMHLRNELIRLQQLRVAVAVRGEIRAGVLEPSTRLEITALDKLLEAAKADQQLLGVLPGASGGDGEQDVGAVRDAPDGDGGGPAGGAGVPEWAADRSFGDVVPGLNPAAEQQLARVLQEAGLFERPQVGGSNGHGQVVDGG